MALVQLSFVLTTETEIDVEIVQQECLKHMTNAMKSLGLYKINGFEIISNNESEFPIFTEDLLDDEVTGESDNDNTKL